MVWRKFVFNRISFFLYCVVLTIVADMVFGNYMSGRGYRFSRLKSYLQGVAEPEYLPRPYLNYQNNPAFQDTSIQLHINSWGIRGESDILVDKAPNSIRILFLGGSTTFSEVSTEFTFPVLVSKILNGHQVQSGQNDKVECINAGLGFGTSAEILVQYLLKWKYLHPDIVVIHVGINDAIMMHNKEGYVYQPDYHTVKKSMKEIPKPSYITKLVGASNILTFIYIKLLMNEHLFYSEENNEFVNYHNEGVWLKDGNELKYDKAYNAFYNNISELVKIIQSNGSQPVIMSEVYDTTKVFPIKFLSPNEIERNSAFLQEISDMYSVQLCKLSLNDFPPDCFIPGDGIHLNVEGERKKAEQISQVLIPIIADTQ